MKRKFVCMLNPKLTKPDNRIEVIDRITSQIIEGIQIKGGDILSISLKNYTVGFFFIYMVFYEDYNHNEEIEEFLKDFRFTDFIN